MLKTILAGAALTLLTAMPAFAACTEISSKTIALTGCVDGDLQVVEGSVQEFSFFTADQSIGFMIITEKGSATATQYRQAILQNAASGAGGNADDVKIVRERVVNIDNKPVNLIEYTIPNDGNPILFQNFYYSSADVGSLQIIVYSLVPDATASAFFAGSFAGTAKIGG